MTSAAVVVCSFCRGPGRSPDEAGELLTLGRKARTALGAELRWLVLGPIPDGAPQLAARYGVTAIDRIEDAKLAHFAPDPTVEALAQYCAERPPRLILLPQDHDTRLVAPRLAGRLVCGVVMNGVDLDVASEDRLQVTASAYGGDTRAIYEVRDAQCCVVALMPNAVPSEPGEASASSPSLCEFPVDLSATEERIRVVEQARAQGPRLEDADVIVAGGRGLGSPENYKLIEQLAEALGGMAGASRPIVDDGWVDTSRQVGLTGRITRPALYIAAGISGASQHMAGCSAAKTIAAINTDPDAAIFRYARYGVVGDCVEILPELIRAAKAR